MKMARFSTGPRILWGFVDGDSVRPAGPDTDLTSVLARPENIAAAKEGVGEPILLADVDLLAPIPEPPQFIGVGLNYRAHAEEAGFDIPAEPVTFPFHRSSIIGPDTAIEIPDLSDKIDWEAELAIVVGRGGRNLDVARALDHVAGYTIVNDVTARDIQFADGQWSRSKSFDTFKPMGPWITGIEELGAAADLEITLTVNGEIKQSSSTADLIFGIADLVSYISRGTTLLPGAVISTGTPAGIGWSRNPPEFLEDGDMVAIEISGIGVLANPVT